jgi:replication fork clamp-binding protein CrfC
LEALKNQLSQLRVALRKEAETLEHDTVIGQVAAAEIAAKDGNGVKTLEHLKNAGQWALNVAEKVGIPIAVVALKSSMGL